MRRDHNAKQRLGRIVLRAGGKEGRGGRSRVKSSIFNYPPARHMAAHSRVVGRNYLNEERDNANDVEEEKGGAGDVEHGG